MEGVRINKYLSQAGFCSRREADRLIQRNQVLINGKIPEMGTRVQLQDTVEVDGKIIRNESENNVYLAFNKPIGIVCTADQKREKNNIIDYINYPKRVFYAGRLDKNSEGLILLTNDGEIVNKIMRSRNNHEKEYIVSVHRPLTNEFLQKMGAGVPILDTVTKKCRVEKIEEKTFRIILSQGLNRQIRRMCEYFGYRVTALQRVRIMNIQLDLEIGKWRDLSAKELTELRRLIE